MATNSFFCTKCGKITKQIEISPREYHALWDRWYNVDMSAFTRFVCDTGDEFIGLNKFENKILGIRCFKCCSCGYPTKRKLNGDECV